MEKDQKYLELTYKYQRDWKKLADEKENIQMEYL